MYLKQQYHRSTNNLFYRKCLHIKKFNSIIFTQNNLAIIKIIWRSFYHILW